MCNDLVMYDDDSLRDIRLRSFSCCRLSAVYGRTGGAAPVADNILPCVLEVREETEESWIHAVTMDVDPSTLTFKHAPAYCLYLLARYRASTSYRPDVTPMERANRLSLTFAKVATILYTMVQVIQMFSSEFTWPKNENKLDMYYSSSSSSSRGIIVCVCICVCFLVSTIDYGRFASDESSDLTYEMSRRLLPRDTELRPLRA